MVLDNHPDFVVMDVAIPNDSNIRNKEHKLEKYQRLREELEKMWKIVTSKLGERQNQVRYSGPSLVLADGGMCHHGSSACGVGIVGRGRSR
ncbi:hypothetical protein P4O66_002673 [Electrophorus voltai]|uniref:Uncharacterized protein n=1 Tax=Electrophorus voltai TaxID=2609070 RepID=A0AAD9DNV1_9TELE|nr:hypothetical protein P4O66_002673 [Electrophorus voltai]